MAAPILGSEEPSWCASVLEITIKEEERSEFSRSTTNIRDRHRQCTPSRTRKTVESEKILLAGRILYPIEDELQYVSTGIRQTFCAS